MTHRSATYSAAALTIWLSASPTYAYIDGGSASMLFQLLIAGVLGAAFALKSYWTRVKTFFTSLGRKRSSSADD